MKDLFLSAIPELQILTEASDLQYFGKDVCQQFAASPSVVLMPNSVEQVIGCLKVANQHSIAIVPSAGRTGYSGGATASKGEAILSVVKLNQILELNETDRTISVQAGVTLETVQNYAKEYKLLYPVDFTSRGSCLIGGTIATNAGGTRVIRHGLTRDWVLGLKVVTGQGKLLELNGSLIKNQTGLDLKQLFIGSEGVLGIIVEATLKLTADRENRQLAFCGFNSVKDIPNSLVRLRRAGLEIELFEFMEDSCLELVLAHQKLTRPFADKYPAYALIEVDSGRQNAKDIFEAELGLLIEEEVLADVALSESLKQYADLMALRELIGETANQHYTVHKNDLSVPVHTMPEFLQELKALLAEEAADFQVLVFGHIGDGNLHLNILLPKDIERASFWAQCKQLDRLVFALVQKYKGSISAEHGVGMLKKPYLLFSRTEQEIALMKQIKEVFDPKNIMNPGKIFD